MGPGAVCDGSYNVGIETGHTWSDTFDWRALSTEEWLGKEGGGEEGPAVNTTTCTPLTHHHTPPPHTTTH